MQSTMLCRRRCFRRLAERGSAIPTGLAALRIGGICGQSFANWASIGLAQVERCTGDAKGVLASVMFCASDNASHSLPSPVDHRPCVGPCLSPRIILGGVCAVPSDHVQAVSRSWCGVGLRVDEPCVCGANEHTCCSVDGVVAREIPSVAVCGDVVCVFDSASPVSALFHSRVCRSPRCATNVCPCSVCPRRHLGASWRAFDSMHDSHG